ncbi:MAG: hypothetical protein IIA87_05160 [Nanoarchaeota archaeon]|nr:hypothetical protein [Nanoarchaeota archaeon]
MLFRDGEVLIAIIGGPIYELVERNPSQYRNEPGITKTEELVYRKTTL